MEIKESLSKISPGFLVQFSSTLGRISSGFPSTEMKRIRFVVVLQLRATRVQRHRGKVNWVLMVARVGCITFSKRIHFMHFKVAVRQQGATRVWRRRGKVNSVLIVACVEYIDFLVVSLLLLLLLLLPLLHSFLHERGLVRQAGGRPPRVDQRGMVDEEVSKHVSGLGGLHCRWPHAPLTVPDHEGGKGQLSTDSERDDDGKSFLHEGEDVRFHPDEVDIRLVPALAFVQCHGPVKAGIPPTF